MNIKKYSLLLAVTLLTTLAACDGNNKNGNPVEGTDQLAGSVDQLIRRTGLDDPLLLAIDALQVDIDSLAAGGRDSEPVIVMQGDTAASIVSRARSGQ